MRATHAGAIWAIFRKDLTLYSRELIFVFLTILSIVTFVTLYWVLPKDVDETISMAVSGDELRMPLEALAGEEEEGLALQWLDGADEVRAAVEAKDVEVGLVFSDGFITNVRAGSGTTVTVYVRPNLPEEITGAMESMVREIAYAVAGYQLPVTEPEGEFVVLGDDMAGDQVPFRERMKPLYAFIILMMEAISLAALISAEIHERTVTAMLSTPARVGDILMAKGIFGTLIAFSEAVIILLLIRAFGPAPLLVLVTVFLGAILVTAVAMLAGSAGKDLMGTMLLGILILIPLAIPAFSVMFPGSPAEWIRWLPSYGIVHVIFTAATQGASWADSSRELLILAGWCVVFAGLGTLVLKRRVETL